MRAYVIRRLLLLIPTLWIVSVIVFLLVRFLPGDVLDLIESQFEAMNMQIDREAFMRMLGLDVPVHVQYGRWMEGILLRGTLGKSLFGDFAVEERILAALPVTLQLGVISLVIAQVIALPVGIYSAMRQDTAADYAGRTIAVIGLATPNFWLGIMVMIFPAIWWGWSPPMEWVPFAKDPAGNVAMFIIPSLILGTALSATTMRMTRTMMLEVLRQDYVRTAWSKGLKEQAVVVRHALNNLVIDLVYAFLDPRVRYS